MHTAVEGHEVESGSGGVGEFGLHEGAQGLTVKR